MSTHPRGFDQTLARTNARALALFPLWLALTGGLVEVLIVSVEKQRGPLMAIGRDFVWMAPLALMVIALAAITSLRVVGFVWPPGRSAALFVSSLLVSLNLLMLMPGLAHYAAVLLAVGVATQVTRVVRGHQAVVALVMRRSAAWLVAGFVGAGVFMWTPLRSGHGPVAVPAPGSPNLVLITLDTVRAANLSGYGYARQTTPWLDRFAQRGIVFEQAIASASWTLPSHASIFTGRWPHELSAGHTSPLDGTYPTLAEYLGARGYRTAGFVANLKYCGASTGLGRGFEVYEDYGRSVGEIASSSTLARNVANNFRLRRLIQDDQHINRITAKDLNARATSWVAAQTGAPFFLFLNYFDAHEPYLPPPPFDRQFGQGRLLGRHSPLHHWLWNPAVGHEPLADAVRQEEIDAYDGGLASLDHQVGLFLDELERHDLLSNTVVLITSDHGEEFAEHGVYEHGYSLYRPSVHVPLIIVSPGRVAEARRVATPVSLRDLAASIVDILGLGEGAPFPGASLAQLWRRDGLQPVPDPGWLSPLLSEVSPSASQPDWFPSSRGEMKAIVHQGLRYIRNGDGREELYAFAADPWEQTNLAALPERQQALADARATLDRFLRSVGR